MPPKIRIKFKRASLPKQLWQLVALSVNEKVAGKQEIRSIFFDGSSQEFTLQFATPVLPELPSILPGIQTPSDQTRESTATETSGSSCVTLSTKVDGLLIPDDGQPPISERGIKRKRSPVDSGVDVDSELSSKMHRASSLAGSEESGLPATLPSLPKDVLTLILDELVSKDIVHLSLTCRQLLRAGASHMLDTVAADLGAWAGENVICIGNEAGDGDYPPVIEALHDFFDPDGEKEDHVSLYQYANRFCQRVPVSGFYPVLRNGIMLSKAFDDEFYRLPVPIIKDLMRLLCPTMQDYYPNDKIWVLRNLSTREYVQSSEFSLGSYIIHGCGSRRVSFGDVVLSRICWSSEHPVEFDNRDGMSIHRGPWAGCRLDITTLEKHEQECARERPTKIIKEGIATRQRRDWVDITHEAREVLAGVWGQQYGTHSNRVRGGRRRM